jgi:hypothetical protein
MFINKSFCRFAAIAAVTAALTGCHSGTVSDTAHAANVQQTVDSVKNNPNIPDQAKAQILSSMQQQHGSGAQTQPH